MKLIVLLTLIFAGSLHAETCATLSDGDFIANSSTAEQCLEYIVMTYQNYNSMQSEVFNTEAYDYGFEGVIRMWIAGLGVGAILGMLYKLRR